MKVEDKVWVTKGTVTADNSKNTSVDGMLHHVLDVHRIVTSLDEDCEEEEENEVLSLRMICSMYKAPSRVSDRFRYKLK